MVLLAAWAFGSGIHSHATRAPHQGTGCRRGLLPRPGHRTPPDYRHVPCDVDLADPWQLRLCKLALLIEDVHYLRGIATQPGGMRSLRGCKSHPFRYNYDI